MPHSSGGGSHGGGSHGGGFRGGSGSRGRSGPSGPKISSHYRPGYHRYVSYRAGRPLYFFSRGPVTRKDTSPDLISPIFALIISCLLLIPLLKDSFTVPRKLSMNYDTAVRVEDRGSVLSDQDEALLSDIFTRFRDKTGITPVFLSVPRDQWTDRYKNFNQFAYDAYVSLFSDESHWLLCYSAGSPGDFDDWVWEGMQGDDTDRVLTRKVTSAYTRNVQKYLTARNRYTVGQAFRQGMEDILPGLMKPSFSLDLSEYGPLLLVFLCMLGFSVSTLIENIRQARLARDKVDAVQCPSDQGTPQEDTCEYCGGVFVHGLHVKCPHCGAAVRAPEPGGTNK